MQPIKKHAALSKTIWTNVIMALVGAIAIWKPGVKEIVTPEVLVIIFSFVNMILRKVSKDEIYFKGD